MSRTLGLGERCVAATWRHQLIRLYGGEILNHSQDNDLKLTPDESSSHNPKNIVELTHDESTSHKRKNILKLTHNETPHSSVTFGEEGVTRNFLISSFNERLNTRKSKFQGRSTTSIHSYCDLPEALDPKYAELNKSLETYGVCQVDHKLGKYLRRLRVEILTQLGEDDEDEEDPQNSSIADKGLLKVVDILAKLVAHRMSGPPGYETVPHLVSYITFMMDDLKKKSEMNILPIGQLKAGLQLERALLFKVLADRIGLPCTLVRGDYGLAFNEIPVPCPNNVFPLPWKFMKPNFIVDLMSNVGSLYFIETKKAHWYRTSPH